MIFPGVSMFISIYRSTLKALVADVSY